jgi:hypothetical protein
MANIRPKSHFERKVVLKHIVSYFDSPEADADLTLVYRRGFAETVTTILARYEAQARSQVALSAANEQVTATNIDADAKLRTLSMHTSMNRGPEALAELERAWGGQPRSQLAGSANARQVAALDKLFAAVDAGLELPVSETHLNEVRAANTAMSDALTHAARCAATAKADTDALDALLPSFDGGWVRLATTAKELLGDKVGLLVPDLSPYRRGGARAKEAEAAGAVVEQDNDDVSVA